MTGPSVSVEDAVDVSTINRYSTDPALSLLTDQQRHSLVHILARLYFAKTLNNT
jgi:hypothetical protein